MTRSAEFSHTVKHGVRAVQSDLVVHACRSSESVGPQIGFIVSKSVGGSVVRHRVTRRLRHILQQVVPDLDPADRIVVRALPGSRAAGSAELRAQVTSGLRRAHFLMERLR